ncbi:MAG: thiamine diphosphokinase, partial [Verrucomicrobia bacterium]|nr:thiamine diphosphokinase [Verrucomicrobiota bacterium]
MIIADIPPHVAIVANGCTENSEKILDRIQSFSYLVAVDGGSNACYALKLTPQLIIGDMDSISPEASAHFADVPKICFPREKDETDLELALNHLIANHVQEITIFGGLGNRVDHTLANIILLSRFPGKVFLESESERLSVI